MARAPDRQRPAGRARTTSAPKTIPNYDKVAAGAIRSLRGGGKTFVGPRRRPVLRRPRRRRSTASTSASRPTSASATRAAARTTSRATTPIRSCCRCPRREVTTDRQAVGRPDRRPTRSSACGRPPSARRVSRSPDGPTSPSSAQLGPGLAPRQPADQRGRHPARPEGQVQPHDARPTTPRTSASTSSSPSSRGC